MKRLVVMILATAIHVHSVTPNGMVAVKTCGPKPRWAVIYADKRMTIPMANPFVAGSDGSYEFYSPLPCVDVTEWKGYAKGN